MQPRAVDPKTPLQITLTAEQWNVVLHAMRNHAMPFDVSAPIMTALSEQFERATFEAAEPPQMPEMHGKANGHATADHPSVSEEQPGTHPAP